MLISDFCPGQQPSFGATQARRAGSGGGCRSRRLSDRTYGDIERGTVNMRLETLLRICRVLHITPDELLTEDPADISAQEDEVLQRLKKYPQKLQKTAYDLITIYLNSID